MVADNASLDEQVIAGPYALFEGSFILEFLEPDPSRNASVLMRATYKHGHHLCQLGKGHPQVPPLHLHFNQSETFQVLSGKVGTTMTYDVTDRVWTNEDEPQEIPPWVPHSFWPCPESSEDSVLLVWAHPNDVADKMDTMFFQTMLRYVSDVSEGKEKMDVFQVMLLQVVSASTLVWFPKVKVLGSLRWWVPWKMQGAFATVARWLGRRPIMAKYVDAAEGLRL